jgi:RHS repeat-associated protein
VRSLGIVDTPFTLSGLFGVVTDEQGLSWMRYRWYNPEIRRFLTEDAHFGSIMNPESLNRYAYAGNNPISRVDPEGEAPWVVIGAAVGATVSLAVEFTTDLIDDGQINNGVASYVEAAVGGAVTGAIVTACPTCSGAFAGAAGAAAGSIVGGILKGENLTSSEFLVGLGTDVAFGAAFGAMGSGKGGVKAGRALSKRTPAGDAVSIITPGGRLSIAAPPVRTASVFTPGGMVDIPVPSKFQPKVATKFIQQFKEGLYEARWDFPVAFIQEGIEFGLRQLTPDSAAGSRNAVLNLAPVRKRPVTTGGNATVLRRSVDMLNKGNTGVYGEFAHWGDYVRFLQAADKPVIQETAQQLRSF